MRNASASLQTIATAQFDFRDNDRDGNGKRDFWRADIASLCFLSPDGKPIKLIEPSVALADAAPLEAPPPEWGAPGPKAGFRFRTLRLAGESSADPNRFAACAFPELYESGRQGTYIIAGHDLAVYKKDLGPNGSLDAYPADPLREGWEKLD